MGGSRGDNTPACLTGKAETRSKSTAGSKEQIPSRVPAAFISRLGGGIEWFPPSGQWKEACLHWATGLRTAGVSQIRWQGSSFLPSRWYRGAHPTAYQLWNKRSIRSSTWLSPTSFQWLTHRTGGKKKHSLEFLLCSAFERVTPDFFFLPGKEKTQVTMGEEVNISGRNVLGFKKINATVPLVDFQELHPFLAKRKSKKRFH